MIVKTEQKQISTILPMGTLVASRRGGETSILREPIGKPVAFEVSQYVDKLPVFFRFIYFLLFFFSEKESGTNWLTSKRRVPELESEKKSVEREAATSSGGSEGSEGGGARVEGEY